MLAAATMRYAECLIHRLPMERAMTRKSHHHHPSEPARAKRAPLESLDDARLDEALKESFPASDPVAIDVADPYHTRVRKAMAENRKRH